jgi:NADPH:quinone reductase
LDYAITIEAHGGPEVLSAMSVKLGSPAHGEVRMRNTVIGLNFIDTYHRSGLYPTSLPTGIGLEAAGFVEAVGPGVVGFAVGDRVCTFGPQLGAYASVRNIPARALFTTPDYITDGIAASSLLKGCTTEFLAERCARISSGEVVLVHAAAGGVGLLLVQWLKQMGVVVIGAVSTAEKARLAQDAGSDHTLIYEQEDIASAVNNLTGGRGVSVSFDGVGRETWLLSLAVTARRGLIVSFGNASGPVTDVTLAQLASNGSLYVTRPTLADYYATDAERRHGSGRLFEMLRTGNLKVEIGQRYALRDVARAHADLIERKTVGSTLLLP